jgi:putative flavoprotein involved in K+ transport
MERYGTVVVGGGQAGLSVAYHLQRRGESCVVLDANDRIGDSWRARGDSLRLFSPAKDDGLDGTPFPADPWSFPTRDEMADYLEAYAAEHRLPVRSGVRVDGVRPDGAGGWVVTAGDRRFAARNVVLACGTYQVPKVPAFAGALDPRTTQLHSSEWRDASQLRSGDVLVVGAGNSGADIALQAVAAGHATSLAGRHVGQLPFDIDGRLARLVMVRLVMRGLFHHVLTLRSPIGRAARPKILGMGGPLIRYRLKDYATAGVERLPRVAGVRDGRPELDDGRVLDVANVVWCTGFTSDWSWVDVPGFATGESSDGHGGPAHERGVVTGHPGLYLVGAHFLYSMSSAMIHGVGRDADHVAAHVARHRPAPAEPATAVTAPSEHAGEPARPAGRRG